MNHRQLQELEGRRDISAELAALEHVEVAVERFSTLPTSEIRKDIDVLKIEQKLAANLDDALRLIRGSSRAGELLNVSFLGDLREAEIRLSDAQSEMARRKGDQ